MDITELQMSRRLITDLPAYMRRKNAERRANAKARGVCIECNSDPARPGRTKCEGCANAQSVREAA